MAKFVLKGTRLFSGGADLTSVSNKVELSAETEDAEVTAFNPASSTVVWKEVLGGLSSCDASCEGQWEATDASKVDNEAWTSLGGVGAFTVFPIGGAVAAGDVGYLTKMLNGSYTLGGAVGDVAPWSLELTGSWPLVRGACINAPGTARTTTGTGTSLQIGALLSTQALYVTLHILSISGTSTPTLTVTVQSDTATGFPSSATQATFAAATAIGSQTVKIAGPITDDWWRVGYTISGSSPSFLFLATAGIGPA